MSLKEIGFIITHPIAAAEAKLFQADVASNQESAPNGSSAEEFSQLPVSEAAALLHTARSQSGVDNRGGVQLEDWSASDQQRLLRGERPLGVPIHRNV